MEQGFTMITGRRTVLAGGAALFAVPAAARAAPLGERLFLSTGWIPGADAHGIYSATFDPTTGLIGAPVLQADAPNPLYISFSPDRRFLYAGMSAAVLPGEHSRVLGYAVEGLQLRPICAADARGIGSRDPLVTPDMRHLLHVNYETGEVVCSKLGRDGAIGETLSIAHDIGSGPSRPRQAKPHPHGIRLSPGGGFVVVTDLGTDQHVVYRFDSRDGRLEPHGAAAAPAGSGPRHMEFHRSGHWLYSTNELGGGLNILAWRDRGGRLTWLDTVATTPAGFTGKNTTSDLALHPDGVFLYVSNRGHASIATFAIDPHTGRLAVRGHSRAPDEYSWGMRIHPSGRWLVVSCRTTNAVSVLSIDPRTGLPGAEVCRLPFANPAAIRFA